MPRCAVVFPGQGAPDLAGIRAFAGTNTGADRAAKLLGHAGQESVLIPESELDLGDTVVQQPLLGVASALSYEMLESLAPGALADAVHVGASVGELFAVAAAGALGWEDAIATARVRGILMQGASRCDCAMASVFRLGLDQVSALCEANPGVVVVASDVAEGQVLISGESRSVEEVCRQAHEESGKRPLRLPISIAAHSPLMEAALPAFREHLRSQRIERCTKTVWSSLSAEPMSEPREIRHQLASQLVFQVQWRRTVERLIASGVSYFVGMGPSASLLRQIERNNPGVEVWSASNPESVETAAVHMLGPSRGEDA